MPNVRIEGVGNNQYDYYEITVTADNVYLALDIDATSSDYDSRIRLLDSNGTQLKDSDDATPTEEGTGLHGEYRQLLDPYSTHGGHLLIQVGAWTQGGDGMTVISAGRSYVLHVSASENSVFRTTLLKKGPLRTAIRIN